MSPAQLMNKKTWKCVNFLRAKISIDLIRFLRIPFAASYPEIWFLGVIPLPGPGARAQTPGDTQDACRASSCHAERERQRVHSRTTELSTPHSTLGDSVGRLGPPTAQRRAPQGQGSEDAPETPTPYPRSLPEGPGAASQHSAGTRAAALSAARNPKSRAEEEGPWASVSLWTGRTPHLLPSDLSEVCFGRGALPRGERGKARKEEMFVRGTRGPEDPGVGTEARNPSRE